MNNQIEWTDKMRSLLLYWRNICKYRFTFIADVMSREFNQKVTKDACIGLHDRMTKKKSKIDRKIITEYLPGYKG